MLQKEWSGKLYLPWSGLQPWNGSPVYCRLHEHEGVWLITVHCVLKPQDPGQGSTHFWFMHARLAEHSELIVHSGRQFGGDPMYVCKQEQAGLSPITLHSEWWPHGDGRHGLIGTFGVSGNSLLHRVNGSPV